MRLAAGRFQAKWEPVGRPESGPITKASAHADAKPLHTLAACALALALLGACATAQAQQAQPTPQVPQAAASPVPAAIAAAEGTSLNPAEAPAGAYTLDGRHASVVWRVRHSGLGLYTARFDTISGALTFDPQTPANSTVNVTIATNSVSTGLRDSSGELAFDRSIANVLGAEEHPQITFASRSIQITGPTTGLITGDLTFNGRTNPVTLEATFHGNRHLNIPRSRDVVAFGARTIIRRSQWGAGSVIFNAFASDEVEILIDAEFTKD
jgi:polyisoprenoid-binding protein YceI